jgi:type II secretory ATPase GspE/PulE/Tfp pilus assembly ATPase PilB-like protein/ActR/RegA family two-component response regulator
MGRVVARAGFAGAANFSIPADASIEEVWLAATESCGIDPDELAAAVATSFRTEVADFEDAAPTAVKLIPGSTARKYRIFPLKDRDRHLIVATSDPTDMEAEQEVGFASGRAPVLHIAPPVALLNAIDAQYSPDRAAETLLAGVDDAMDTLVEVVDADDAPVEAVTEEDSASGPVVRLTSMILHEAISRGSSDIHIQPLPTGGLVRFRVDGVLRNGMQMPLPVLTRVISRIKIMSKLDITDRLRPQDGRARVVVERAKYDLRVSTVPTRNAEKCVIRILDPASSGTLDDTGVHDHETERIRRVLSNRDGIFVVTGPTGSGKTTTLYAALREISTEDVNIMTVEDPVEYELPGLTQIQVEPKQGVTFASALKAILRQDPDVIFVGEIRDGETSGIAAQASLTGHLVLATLHTNDAVGAIRRFTDLGLDSATLTETLRGALAQRLVRRVCAHCAVSAAEPYTEKEKDLSQRYQTLPTMRVVGCGRCSGQGYLGRRPVTEFMTVTPDLVRLILSGAPPMDLQHQAQKDGMRTLLESALARVEAGETTLEEVERVIGDAELPGQTAMSAEEVLAVDAAAQARVPVEVSPAAPPPPVAPPAPPAPPVAPVVAASAHGPDEGEAIEAPHILVVDDDGANRMIARGLLEKQGYRVTEASDGSEALVLLARGEHFSLMVLDLDMPMLGGREVLTAVRRSVTTAGLPVVVLTGTRDPESEIELMENGADDYIRKPIDPPRFLTRVKATLRRAGG